MVAGRIKGGKTELEGEGVGDGVTLSVGDAEGEGVAASTARTDGVEITNRNGRLSMRPIRASLV